MVIHGEVIGGVDGDVAVPAEDGPVLLAEEKSSPLLADVAERGRRGGRGVEEGEAAVLAGELVGAVDAAVAGVAEGGLVGAAEDRRSLYGTDVALYLHL